MLASILIGCVLACLAGLAVVYIIRQKRRGKCIGCDAASCGKKCSCCHDKPSSPPHK